MQSVLQFWCLRGKPGVFLKSIVISAASNTWWMMIFLDGRFSSLEEPWSMPTTVAAGLFEGDKKGKRHKELKEKATLFWFIFSVIFFFFLTAIERGCFTALNEAWDKLDDTRPTLPDSSDNQSVVPEISSPFVLSNGGFSKRIVNHPPPSLWITCE